MQPWSRLLQPLQQHSVAKARLDGVWEVAKSATKSSYGTQSKEYWCVQSSLKIKMLLNVLLAPKASPSGVWEVVKSTTKKYYL